MEEQQVKPSDLPPTSSDNQDSVATPPVTSADPVRLVASSDSPSEVAGAAPAAVFAPTAAPAEDAAGREAPASVFSASGLSSWAKNLKIPQPSSGQESPTGKNTFARLTSGLGLRMSPKAAQQDEGAEGSTSPTTGQPGVFGSLTKGIVDSSKNAVKAVQVKARHMVSQNKRRYQVLILHGNLKMKI
jgi:phosphatidylinositol-3,4,5-trisphosphate 3-phosphatase/dual-specificity protein phosphatase PTEN